MRFYFACKVPSHHSPCHKNSHHMPQFQASRKSGASPAHPHIMMASTAAPTIFSCSFQIHVKLGTFFFFRNRAKHLSKHQLSFCQDSF